MATKIFLIAGQSNAQGYGKRVQLDPVPGWAQNTANGWEGAPTTSSDSGFQYPHPTVANFSCLYNEFNTGLIGSVQDSWKQFGDADNQATGNYGPELSFLWKYQQAHPTQDIAAIKCVLGGSSLQNDWLPPDKNMWNVLSLMISQAKARLQNAGISYEWAGFLWMQGEAGAVSPYPPAPSPDYSDQLRTFLAAVRDMTSADMPVMIGRIGNHWMNDAVINASVTVNNTYDELLAGVVHRREQQVLVGGDAGNTWVDTDNLPVLHDPPDDPGKWYHHTGAGYLAMGERFYTSFTALTEPSIPNTLGGGISIAGGMSIG